jgi:hypothetical protein
MASSTHTSSQRDLPCSHTKLQVPFVQPATPPGGAVQAAPHPLQFATSVCRSTQWPPQFVLPSPHATGPPSECGAKWRTQVLFALSHTNPGKHASLSQALPSPKASKSLAQADTAASARRRQPEIRANMYFS